MFLKQKLDEMTEIISNKKLKEEDVLAKIKAICTKDVSRQEKKRAKKEQKKADIPFSESSKKGTPLSAAATRGFISVVKYLIEELLPEENRFDPNEKTHGNQTALGLAILEGHQALSLYLVEKTTDYPCDYMLGYTPLHYAAERGYIAIVRAIVKKVPELVHVVSDQGTTALHRAAEEGHVAVVKLLLDYKASPTNAFFRGFTPYGAALFKKRKLVIDYFLRYCESSSAIQYTYCDINLSPLLLVADDNVYFTEEQKEAFYLLLQAGAGILVDKIPNNVKNWIINDPMHCLLSREKWEFLIMGEIKQEGGSSPVFLTNFNDLKRLLDNPNSACLFKWEMIKKTLQDPRISEYSVIKELNNFILPEKINSSSKEEELIESIMPILPKERRFRELNLHDYNLQKIAQMRWFMNENEKSMNFVSWVFTLLKNFTSEEKRKFNWDPIFFCFFYKLNAVVSIVLNQHSGPVDSLKIEIAVQEFFKNLFCLIESENSINDVGALSSLLEGTQNTMRLFEKNDKRRHADFYFILASAKAYFAILLANKFYKAADFASAQLLSHRVLYEIDREYSGKDESLKTVLDLTKTICFAILANCCCIDNRIEEAIAYLECALAEEMENSLLVKKKELLIISAMEKILESQPSETMRLRVMGLLKKVIKKMGPLKDEEIKSSEIIFKKALAEYERLWQEQEEKERHWKKARDEEKSLKQAIEHKQDIIRIENSVSFVTENVENFSLEPKKEKIKTRKSGVQPKVEKLMDSVSGPSKPNDYGFDMSNLEGFLPPVPITGGALPAYKLFMTMPADDPDFKGFYHLIEGGIVKSIASRGLNEQGIKLGKATILNENNRRVEIRKARLKTKKSTKRAHGKAEQKIKTEHGLLQLFVMRTVKTKKQEAVEAKRCKA